MMISCNLNDRHGITKDHQAFFIYLGDTKRIPRAVTIGIATENYTDVIQLSG